MTVLSKIVIWSREFGYRQAPVWYASSRETIDVFNTAGKKLRILNFIPNPFPLYDWIMGFYERPSDREALHGQTLERFRRIIEVGAGTGYLLSQLVRGTTEAQQITAVDLSEQMLRTEQAYLAEHGQLTGRLEFKQADCTSLPWPDSTFDLYVSSYLFDLLPEAELRQAIREMERVLVPDGYAILITMTTELDGMSRLRKLISRAMNELYRLGYNNGRWNPIWKFLFAGYAPHCRPMALARYLREADQMIPCFSKPSRVSLFPARIYYLRKGHD